MDPRSPVSRTPGGGHPHVAQESHGGAAVLPCATHCEACHLCVLLSRGWGLSGRQRARSRWPGCCRVGSLSVWLCACFPGSRAGHRDAILEERRRKGPGRPRASSRSLRAVPRDAPRASWVTLGGENLGGAAVKGQRFFLALHQLPGRLGVQNPRDRPSLEGRR